MYNIDIYELHEILSNLIEHAEENDIELNGVRVVTQPNYPIWGNLKGVGFDSDGNLILGSQMSGGYATRLDAEMGFNGDFVQECLDGRLEDED